MDGSTKDIDGMMSPERPTAMLSRLAPTSTRRKRANTVGVAGPSIGGESLLTPRHSVLVLKESSTNDIDQLLEVGGSKLEVVDPQLRFPDPVKSMSWWQRRRSSQQHLSPPDDSVPYKLDPSNPNSGPSRLLNRLHSAMLPRRTSSIIEQKTSTHSLTIEATKHHLGINLDQSLSPSDIDSLVSGHHSPLAYDSPYILRSAQTDIDEFLNITNKELQK